MIIRGTTPTIQFTFTEVDPANIVAGWMIIEQTNLKIKKLVSEATVGETYIEWNLTQEETLLLNPNERSNIQIHYRTNDGNAYASKTFNVDTMQILEDGII